MAKKKSLRKPRSIKTVEESSPSETNEATNGKAENGKRAGSAAAKYREYQKENPTATTQQIADHFKVKYGNVYQALKTGKKAGGRTARKAAGTTAHAGNGHAGSFEVIKLAIGLIKKAGGVSEAKEALKVAAELAAALGPF